MKRMPRSGGASGASAPTASGDCVSSVNARRSSRLSSSAFFSRFAFHQRSSVLMSWRT
jgi:hypothetical protein